MCQTMIGFLLQKYFSELPSLSVQRSEHGCGLVRKHKRMPEDDSGEAEKEEELELVVVGGVREASTEIYNFKTKKWRMGEEY